MEKIKLNKYDRAYLRIAKEWSLFVLLQAKTKWEPIIVRDRMIISDGYNGTPSGFENRCEDESGLTNWYVLDAEANAILKAGKVHPNV